MTSVIHMTPAPPPEPGTRGADLAAGAERSAAAPQAERSRGSRQHPGRLSSPEVTHSPFVPLLLSGLALLGWLGYQTQQLVKEREGLRAAHASLQLTVDNAGKLRASLDALAADTQRLANAGNANAKLLVDELRKRGITINPNPPASAQPGASAPR